MEKVPSPFPPPQRRKSGLEWSLFGESLTQLSGLGKSFCVNQARSGSIFSDVEKYSYLVVPLRSDSLASHEASPYLLTHRMGRWLCHIATAPTGVLL
jgi:hypothetical protein